MTNRVQRFSKNKEGRDFIVGDIHGCFTKLAAHLKGIGFNADAGDRLFSVGDLVDRGDESDMAVMWCNFPWFYPVASLPRSHIKSIVDATQWSRGRIESSQEGKEPENVEGVRAVVVGHTPLEVPTWVGNVLHIDTAGWHPNGYGFTVIDAEKLELMTTK